MLWVLLLLAAMAKGSHYARINAKTHPRTRFSNDSRLAPPSATEGNVVIRSSFPLSGKYNGDAFSYYAMAEEC